MAYLIGFLLALASVMILVYPFLNRREQSRPQSDQDRVDWSLRSYRDLLDEINLQNQELELNNITASEHSQAVDELRRRAAVTLSKSELEKEEDIEDDTTAVDELDTLLEQNILILRVSKRGPRSKGGMKLEGISPIDPIKRSESEEE